MDQYELANEGFLMAADAAAQAVFSIVSSGVAAKLLTVDTAGTVRPAPAVLPLAFPDVDATSLRPPRSTMGGRPLIVSLGRVHEIKRPEVLIDAVSHMAPERRPSLVFAGPDALRDSRAFWEHVRSRGLLECVSVTEWLTDDEYADWIRRADVVVQLRERSYGESSAAVTDAMAFGRAVVTSVAGCSDFPPGVHVQVAQDVTADALEQELAPLLFDPARRASLEDGARSFAREWSFDRVAAELVNLVRGASS
jgi:glycosyltransferase involved in cell wall biosynthesis